MNDGRLKAVFDERERMEALRQRVLARHRTIAEGSAACGSLVEQRGPSVGLIVVSAHCGLSARRVGCGPRV